MNIPRVVSTDKQGFLPSSSAESVPPGARPEATRPVGLVNADNWREQVEAQERCTALDGGPDCCLVAQPLDDAQHGGAA